MSAEAYLVLEDGSVFLVGDNPSASTDSRSYGPLSGTAVLGCIRARLPRASR